MSQVVNILKTMINGNEEAKITAIAVDLTPVLFTSRLISGFPRKAIWAYNQSPNLAENSGECYYGYSSQMSPSGESHPIPVQSCVEIPVSVSIPLYFCCKSGETGDLRIEEIA